MATEILVNFKQLYRCAVRAFDFGESLVVEHAGKSVAVQPTKGGELNLIALDNPSKKTVLNEKSFQLGGFADLKVVLGYREFLRSVGGVHAF